jgi:hypothetical protein
VKLTIFFLLLSISLFGQKVETIVPGQPVVTGTAFLVQYVITEPSLLANIISPEFDGLQIVSGPNHYKGTAVVDGRDQAIENVTYTLVASKNGLIKIPGLTAVFKTGLKFTSISESIQVVQPPQASYLSSSAYTDVSLYNPTATTDIKKLIDQNIFIRTEVNKRKVFVGEPVVTSFTLYSRLQAVSEVINTPSLYGFRAIDMLDINRSYQSVKTIGNKVFNTSVIRKLQLYPEQSGKLTIDEMQVRNEIEFDDDLIYNHKKKLEKLLNSSAVSIVVKELPEKKPGNFSGAVGNFTIEASVSKDSLAVNQQGSLIIQINGGGNFSQFSSPVIQWPEGFDVFEPRVQEQVDKTMVPMKGSMKYIFNFVVDSAGSYLIPKVRFSFFDPSTEKYRTVQADSISLQVLPAAPESKSDSINRGETSKWLILVLIPVLLLAVIMFYWIKRQRPSKINAPATNVQPSVKDQLMALDMKNLSARESCTELQKFIKRMYQERSLSAKQKMELEKIEKECQLLAYSDISDSFDKEELKQRLVRILS